MCEFIWITTDQLASVKADIQYFSKTPASGWNLKLISFKPRVQNLLSIWLVSSILIIGRVWLWMWWLCSRWGGLWWWTEASWKQFNSG